ncbi:MAG: hypothetical protein QOH08_10, partial [Chloroflexota bacterium]|nr:hypothetical protein [Chloroflexota bacterium]
AVGFLGVNVRTTPLSMEEGRALAAATAQVTWPDSVLIAAVARYDSPTHGFDRPDRLTYYYLNARNEVLRITYLNGDRFSTDIHAYETEDELDFSLLQPLPAGMSSYQAPATTANDAGGGRLRADIAAGVVRVFLTWPKDRAVPMYSVTIGRPRLLTLRRFCCFDGRTGEAQPGATWTVP